MIAKIKQQQAAMNRLLAHLEWRLEAEDRGIDFARRPVFGYQPSCLSLRGVFHRASGLAHSRRDPFLADDGTPRIYNVFHYAGENTQTLLDPPIPACPYPPDTGDIACGAT